MLEPSPLRNLHEEYAASLRAGWSAPRAAGREGEDSEGPYEVEYLPYGPADTARGDVRETGAVEIVATYGPVEVEYAAIRRGAGILDRPQRGVIRVRGADRRDFLNRLLTQELKDLAPAPAPGSVKRSFWLNRKGRIDADLLIVERESETLLDLDRHQLESTARSLNEFIFTEDVEIAPADDLYRIALHGRRAAEVIAAWADMPGPCLLAPGQALEATMGSSVHCARNDETGEVGLELFISSAHKETVWRGLIETDQALSEGKRRIRPIGWHAFNIARVEAGTPLFNIDFGPTNLPHESGVLDDRVSFTKGCYLGQEVVARMQHLGKPKQVLVGLRVMSDHLPVAGAQVFESREGSPGDSIGVITSSTLSPMLGAAAVAFAMIRSRHADVATDVIVNAEGAQAAAKVHALRFWPEGAHHAEHAGDGEE